MDISIKYSDNRPEICGGVDQEGERQAKLKVGKGLQICSEKDFCS